MLDDRFPAMLVSETLATLVSSTSMKTASITVAAMIHGIDAVLRPVSPVVAHDGRYFP